MRRKRQWPGLTQIVLGCVLLLALLGVGGALGVSSWMNAFLRGLEFRQLVSEKTGHALKAEVSFDPFEWNGANVFSERMTATGLEGSRIGSLQANQVRAAVDWRAAWDGAWKVSSLDILELQVVFRKASESSPQPVTLQEKKRGWLPERFELGFLRAERGTVTFQSEAGEAQVAVSNSVLTLEPKGRSFEVAAKGGTLSVQHLPTMELESANARLSEATLHLTDSHVRLGATGKVTGSGEFGKNSRLQITFEGVDPAPFLSEEWKQRLTGKLAGDALLEWPEDGRMRASGKFLLTEARLEKIPLLDQIAKFTSSPQFRRMPLQEVTGNFVKENGLLTVTNFVGESKGLLKTTGDFTISDEGPVSGEFLIGVSPQVLQWVPGSREKVFKENRDGYVWAPITIGGTMKHPTEDLTGRLKAAMAEEVIDQGAKILEVVPEGVTDGVKEGAKGLMDAVNPLFGR